MDTLYLDLETLPTDRADVIEMLAATIKPPATYKKPESIAAWMEENKASELDALVRKTALDGSFGRVLCAGFAVNDEPVESIIGSELDVLIGFSNVLDSIKSDKYQTTFVGHNCTSFDMRFLFQRYIVNEIAPPASLRFAAQAKPWETDKVYDTMTQWAGFGNRISLDKLCLALGIKSPKGELDGSKVYDFWQAGRLDEIAEYCRRDVEATRQVHKRLTIK